MPEPIDPITISPREVVVLLAHAFDPALSADQRADARLRICGRLLNILDGNGR